MLFRSAEEAASSDDRLCEGFNLCGVELGAGNLAGDSRDFDPETFEHWFFPWIVGGGLARHYLSVIFDKLSLQIGSKPDLSGLRILHLAGRLRVSDLLPETALLLPLFFFLS